MYLIILRLFHLGVSCTVLVLTCIVVVLTCFVMCVCVGFVICGSFGNIYSCIYRVLYHLYCVFSIVSFMYIYSYLLCLY